MTLKIVHKNSVVKDKSPLPPDLEIGEIAVNAHHLSPAAYIKDSAGVVRKLDWGTVNDASETAKGVVQLASAAEVTAGTDTTKSVTPAGLKVELDKKAPLASPALTGTPTAPTAAPGTNTTQLATTAFVHAATPNATATAKGLVQLADAASITAGTAGRVVDAAQLKAVSDADDWTRTGTEITTKVAGDSVFTTGAVKVGGTTASPRINLQSNGTITLGAQNAVSATINTTPATGTDTAGAHLILAAGTPTGAGASGHVAILPSTSAGTAGTTAGLPSSKGVYVVQKTTNWGSNPNLNLLNVVLGASATGNYSKANGDGTVLTLVGGYNNGPAIIEVVGGSNSANAEPGSLSFFGSSVFNPYARITARTLGVDYTSGELVAYVRKAGVETRAAVLTSSAELLTGGKNFPTTNGGDVQVSKGITFPATAVPCTDVNTLDDYEEGTWTPAYSSGSNTWTYTTQVGRYIKIGNMVTVSWYILAQLDTNPGVNGQVTIAVPFPVAQRDNGAGISALGEAFQVKSGHIYKAASITAAYQMLTFANYDGARHLASRTSWPLGKDIYHYGQVTYQTA